MEQKSGAVKALTGGIVHLFKQNKVTDAAFVIINSIIGRFLVISDNWIIKILYFSAHVQ